MWSRVSASHMTCVRNHVISAEDRATLVLPQPATGERTGYQMDINATLNLSKCFTQCSRTLEPNVYLFFEGKHVKSVADLHSKILDARPPIPIGPPGPGGPNSFNFMQSYVPWRVSAPPRGNPGSATANYSFLDKFPKNVWSKR